MFGFLLRWSINLLALVVAGSIINGIRIESLGMGIIAAIILGVVNAVIRPVVLLLTLPINLLTLGLFTLVVNAAMLMLVSALVSGFVIESFRAAFFGALVISLISWVVNIFISSSGTFMFIKRERRGDR
ncbi:MAG: phage holin family protein [Nitrospirae bacterium]|nr:phage holin family protein [Nitrospirota bacterium]